ncbi:toxin [Actinotalea sp. M2MS4P-6]|uniref:toxin n=1 Tax=Actinotalea sp. M2MS4P-6 TaxID=2983762 RepID=UPI0021E48C82|nr:toxin [Actinotalea sp. M2MS4P-6]MCV2395456.1 toxin [Actinotalea sp. M2MS4P-6]
MRVHCSALKHGASPEDAIQAAHWALWIEPLDDEPPYREPRLGFDTGARLLETVVLVSENGEELVIHAMPARRKYLDLLP